MKPQRNTIWTTAALITALFTLSACTFPMTSPERHAKKFIYASDDGFDPNYKMHKYQSIKMAVPLFNQFWLEGKKDKESGVPKEEANKRITYFSSDDFFNSMQSLNTFAGKTYKAATPTPKWRKAMSEAAAGAYRDGYEGRG